MKKLVAILAVALSFFCCGYVWGHRQAKIVYVHLSDEDFQALYGPGMYGDLRVAKGNLFVLNGYVDGNLIADKDAKIQLTGVTFSCKENKKRGAPSRAWE